MNRVSRRELMTATWGLAGVAVLGVMLGIVNTASTLEFSSEAGGRGAPIPMNPAMARSVEAKAIAPEAAPPAPSPKAVADASAKDEAAASDSNADNEAGPSSNAPAPPELYAPPEPGPAAPASAPAADDTNLPPY
jgi:hypothetical protein